ncbi:MAG: bacillithiol biosynthesis cysteine-adding enzyme BshC, partial [Bacteroidetes bacterium]|nr:bacillithiol biosynthesis cysteine-adding enzyme BshC [Bacteroidota bacterium]
MPTKRFPYSDTGYFSKLMCDYLAREKTTESFYHQFPSIENFKAQLSEKGASFSNSMRSVLVKQLNEQYMGMSISEATQNNIDALSSKDTFTITTGHQLNLFTGPLYFLYKIISVI